MEVNPERKSGVEPLRRLDVTQDLLPAASAVLSAPNVMPCIPMDFVDTTERGILLCGLHLVSISFCPGLHPGEDTNEPLKSVLLGMQPLSTKTDGSISLNFL